jgi:hypothetical protein
MKRLLILLLILVMAGSVLAQDNPDYDPPAVPDMLAVNADDQILLYGPDQPEDGMSIFSDFQPFIYTNLQWFDPVTLGTMNTDTGLLTLLGLQSPLGEFQLDSPMFDLPVDVVDGMIYYANGSNATFDETDPMNAIMPVYAQPLDASTPTAEIGQIRYGGGCGGGTSYAMDVVYGIDASFNFNPKLFEYTPAGLVHTQNCAGVGVSVLDLESGELRSLDDTIQRVQLSPDQTRIAGVMNAFRMEDEPVTISVINIADGEATTYETAIPATQITWSMDGQSLYYSTREPAGQLDFSDEQDARLESLLSLPDGIPAYDVTIRQLDLATGDDTPVANMGRAWAVGRMFETPQGLYASVIPNGETWVETITSPDFEGGDVFDDAINTVFPTLTHIDVETGAVTGLIQVILAEPRPLPPRG